MGVDTQTMEIRTWRNLQLILWIGGFALTILAGSCSREEREAEVGGQTTMLPDQIITDFEITETAFGRRDWTMKADSAYLYDRRNLLEAKSIEVTFYDEEGNVRSILRADYGKLNRSSDDMEARGHVVVTSSDGVTLETSSLTWLNEQRKIVSDDSVKITRRHDVLTGWGFRGDPDLGTFTILRQMKATIRHENPNEKDESTGSSYR